jgi:hypothetical protein
MQHITVVSKLTASVKSGKIVASFVSIVFSFAFVSMTLPAMAEEYATVEQWSGGRMRIKRVPTAESEPKDPDDLDSRPANDDRDEDRRQAMNDRSFESTEQPERRRARSDFNQRGVSDAEQPFRRPDRYVDNPQVDADGARHFANGKHFDLSKVSATEAIDSAAATNQNPNLARPAQNYWPTPIGQSPGQSTLNDQIRSQLAPRWRGYRAHRMRSPGMYAAWW